MISTYSMQDAKTTFTPVTGSVRNSRCNANISIILLGDHFCEWHL